MIPDAEKDGVKPATTGDNRITHVGKVIRATRLDECPQLINIFKGDMSIVGPRPERVEHVEKYTAALPEFAYRLRVRGGLTGYAQIYGKYNTSAEDKLKMDLMYIERQSFLLDLQLIFLTVKIMFIPESTEGFN
jgi:lipopolysaccharide/colanic/teichoic acid biosynthesis glycosyltransferase